MSKHLNLGLFIRAHGHHLAAWRSPGTPADAGVNLSHYRRIAQTAERGKLDFIFLADSVGVRASEQPMDAFRRSAHIAHFEPITLLSALSGATERIGLAATASTTYNEPYSIARQFASLDLLSEGRAAWNVVTSNGIGEAANFGRDPHLEHALRYHRAEEFLDVVKALWDSWEDDAFIWDKKSGLVFDPDKLHMPHHNGEHFSVRGPLNVSRPPQGHPVIIQAGGSGPGRDLAARTAEVIFAVHANLGDAQTFYSDIKERVQRAGRSPGHLKVMPGLCPIVGSSRAHAQERYEALQELLDPGLAVSQVSNLLDMDLSGYPLDGPVPELTGTTASKTRLKLLTDVARQEGLTLLQLARRISGTRGHYQLIGTAADIADEMQAWFEGSAADGFTIMPADLPHGLDEFIDGVVPELQRRGLFRTEYAGRTLREHLDLPRP